MTEYICEFSNSIPNTLCEDIIQLFEESTDKYDGCTLGGVNKTIKHTTDFIIPKKDDTWNKIETFLYKELASKILKYLSIIYKKDYENNNYSKKFNFFGKQSLFTNTFMVQKYEKGLGKYIYHDDSAMLNGTFRVITFLWYLNTVDEGGETVVWDNYKIKPEQGKLLLFPSTWTYPHTGKMPISGNKYIITGWLQIGDQY